MTWAERRRSVSRTSTIGRYPMPATPTVTSDLHREEGGTLTVNGVRLYYQEHGTAPPSFAFTGPAARHWCGATRSGSWPESGA